MKLLFKRSYSFKFKDYNKKFDIKKSYRRPNGAFRNVFNLPFFIL